MSTLLLKFWVALFNPGLPMRDFPYGGKWKVKREVTPDRFAIVWHSLTGHDHAESAAGGAPA
jgi:hypothetical protein